VLESEHLNMKARASMGLCPCISTTNAEVKSA
jgi:hypothetical protein